MNDYHPFLRACGLRREEELEATNLELRKKKAAEKTLGKAKNKAQEIQRQCTVLSGDFKRQAEFVSSHGYVHVPRVYGFTWTINTLYLSFIKIAYKR